MSISGTIKTIQDIMRKDHGIHGDAERLNQLTWMIFLKSFDDQELEYEACEDDYVSPLPEELRWRNWAANPEGITGDELLEFVNNQLFKRLKNLKLDEAIDGKGRILKNVFEETFNFMINGNLMREVINKLNEIDFKKPQDKHLFGEICEQILKDLQGAGYAGEYYTPHVLMQFMIDRINPQLEEKILDPACGSSSFFTGASEYLQQQVRKVEDEEKLSQSIMEVERNSLSHQLRMMNMLLHEIDVQAIRHDNAFARPLQDYKPHERFKFILAHLPFDGMKEDRIKSNSPAAYRTKETTSLFLERIMQSLVNGGMAAIILPNKMLSDKSVKTHIKEKLLEEFNLHTIVRLPKGVLNPYTGIQTNVLVFTKGEPTKEIWYDEYPYLLEGVESEKTWRHNCIENEFAWKVSLEEIRTNGYNLDIKKPFHKSILEIPKSAKKLLERFVNLLDTAQRESELQRFFEKHPQLLYPKFEKCIPQPKLAGEYRPDFAISIRDADNIQWIFIEIEKPSKQIFTKGETFHFYHDFTEARCQLLNWASLIEEEQAFFEKRFPGISNAKFHLIYGRDSELDNPRRNMLHTEFSSTTNRQFSTYDDLVNRFQKIIEDIEVF